VCLFLSLSGSVRDSCSNHLLGLIACLSVGPFGSSQPKNIEQMIGSG
jgi:hypothetical protein